MYSGCRTVWRISRDIHDDRVLWRVEGQNNVQNQMSPQNKCLCSVIAMARASDPGISNWRPEAKRNLLDRRTSISTKRNTGNSCDRNHPMHQEHMRLQNIFASKHEKTLRTTDIPHRTTTQVPLRSDNVRNATIEFGKCTQLGNRFVWFVRARGLVVMWNSVSNLDGGNPFASPSFMFPCCGI